ncbi:hypothetical protein TcBrA4_0102410 [Trypanosoma cruzi]|nr:hypothetical protein TcBrA4_0102410 [Trypanosoma cruzi]
MGHVGWDHNARLISSGSNNSPPTGLLTSEALAREEWCSELSYGKEEAATNESQPLVKRNPSPAVASAATKAVEAYSATPAEGGGVLCGNWEEPRQREARRKYDSQTATQEARGKPPPEALEEKNSGAAPQREQQGVQEGIAAKTKGVLRVCGTWKEYRDANSGRLPRQHGDQATYMEDQGDALCKRVIGGMLVYEADGASCGLR